MAKIDNPKVFISYAWASEDYKKSVVSFAEQLMRDGVEVILDVWDLDAGNDTYVFMEQCINDPTITNVLILLDPVYADKANGRQGGVGEETQIISAEIYNDPKQTKFIPVVFQRDAEGKACRPTYLKTRVYYDLSDPEKYEEEYRRLVKKLYGERTYVKPPKGVRPAWIGGTPKKSSAKLTLSKPETGKKPSWLIVRKETNRSKKETTNTAKQLKTNYRIQRK